MVHLAAYLAVFALVFAGHSSAQDDEGDDDTARQEASFEAHRIVERLGQQFACKMTIDEVRKPRNGTEYFVVFYRASGDDCSAAHNAVYEEGQLSKLSFFRLDPPAVDDEPEREPIQDLIHQVDPPM